MKTIIVISCLLALATSYPQGSLSKEQHQLPEQASVKGSSSVEKTAHESSSSAESVPDSYANIGGASGGIASALTATNEYGETVPQAFSSLKEDSYAYYHGQNAA